MNAIKRTYVLKVYIAGNMPYSIRTLRTLKNILEQKFQGIYTLKIIDMLKSPQLADEDKIVATLTLSKVLPQPVCKIVCDLSD